MGSLPSATTTACCVRIAVLAGALFGRAQNKPTRAKTVKRNSTSLFIGGSLRGWILMRRKYMPVIGDCNCDGCGKGPIFRGLPCDEDRSLRPNCYAEPAESGLDCMIKLRSWAGSATNYKERKPASQADSELVALQPGPQAKPGRTELPRDRIETTSFRDVLGRTFLLPPTP
jgi:hypothetical protein